MNKELKEVNEKLDEVLLLLRKPTKLTTRHDKSRNAILLSVFERIINLSKSKRSDYRFPTELLPKKTIQGGVSTEERLEIAPLSLFMNRAEQKNIFDPVGAEASRRENVKSALEICEELVVTTMGEAGLRAGSGVYIVLSRAEAFRRGLIKRKQGEVFPDPIEKTQVISGEFSEAVTAKTLVREVPKPEQRRIPTREECEDEVADDLPPMADEEPEESDGDREERLDRERDAAGKATKHKKALSNVVFDWSAVAKEDAEAEQREKEMKEASVRVAEADKKKRSVFGK